MGGIGRGADEPNYTQIPNIIFEMMPDMKESEFKVVMWICRETFGFHRRAKQLSVQDLIDKTGLGKSAVLAGIQSALDRGIIIRKETILHGRNTWIYTVNVRPSNSVNSEPDRSEINTYTGVKLRPGEGLDGCEIKTSYKTKESINVKERGKENCPQFYSDVNSPFAAAIRKVCGNDKLPLSPKQNEDLIWVMRNLSPLSATVAHVEAFGRKVQGDWLTNNGLPSIMQLYENWNRITALPDPGDLRNGKSNTAGHKLGPAATAAARLVRDAKR